MKRAVSLSVILTLLLLLGSLLLWPSNTAAPGIPNSQKTQSSSKTPPKSEAPSFNKSLYSLTDPNSVWVIVNKSHPLIPKNYVPHDLILPNVSQRVPGAQEMNMRELAARALEQMLKTASNNGVRLLISTAYRSYSYQQVLYGGYVHTSSQAAADTFSARPGYSEHQTGLAVDFRAQNGRCPLKQCFGDTPEGKWLAVNAHKYGFLLRYPKDKEVITGYHYEPWHFRYVGIDLSNELYKKSVPTLEEFFHVSGGTAFK